MPHSDRHRSLIDTGLELHESRNYADALPLFQRALREVPLCVCAQYNVANTLHMLERDKEAKRILHQLLETRDETFLEGCPFEEDPTSYKLDALFLLFLTTLYSTGSWEQAFPYASRYLTLSLGPIESIFPREFVEEQIEFLRTQFVIGQ